MDKMSSTSSVASYSTSSAAMAYGTLTTQDWIAMLGLFFLVLTFIVNFIYKHMHWQLAKDEAAFLRESLRLQREKEDADNGRPPSIP